MYKPRDAKEYAWRRITASAMLCKGACDFVYADLHPSGADAEIEIFDGESVQGDLITGIFTSIRVNREFKPTAPIYCKRGLYINIIARTCCVFVQWRPRLAKEG
ncbi:unnamed protein product [marine sediment metagenome]|uniref:Uncharacterized protein n=1 Tax=marine sediment metagenome TaxID=412755 RepID=X1K328_9ZZZZ